MFFQHIYDKSLSQSSYLIGCQTIGKAIVLDPKRDIDTYLALAEENNLTITHIAETHIHADFLCGSRELAAVTGAELYLSDEGGAAWQYEFPHTGLKDGDKISIGKLTLDVIHTPGHTPESISFLLTDHAASDQPVMIFTGDFIFVGDVGRPDLLEKAAGFSGTTERGVQQLYQSLRKFADLLDYVQVWSGHGAGSACGKLLGSVPSSTVGYEKIRNWAFQLYGNEEKFADYLLAGQPEAPRYFAMMKRLNKERRPLLAAIPPHPKLTKEQFKAAYDQGIQIIDTRDKRLFAKGFLLQSINIQANNSFSTWMGWLLSYEEQFMLIADDEQMSDLTRKLMRIGLDNILGYISDICDVGVELQKADVLSLPEFKSYLNRNDVQLVDVRNASEYREAHIEGSHNIFVGTLTSNLNKIDKDKHLVVYCQSGDRATIAHSILIKNGFNNVKYYTGGMKEWLENKEPVITKSVL
jgi:hydroxyacylglutathione hydrolase